MLTVLILRVKTDKALLDGMGDWCMLLPPWSREIPPKMFLSGRIQHGKTGLTEACLNATEGMQQVEDHVLRYIGKHFKEPKALLAGNSVHVDKRWLVSRSIVRIDARVLNRVGELKEKDMPRLHNKLHYRICDVSSIKGKFDLAAKTVRC